MTRHLISGITYYIPLVWLGDALVVTLEMTQFIIFYFDEFMMSHAQCVLNQKKKLLPIFTQ